MFCKTSAVAYFRIKVSPSTSAFVDRLDMVTFFATSNHFLILTYGKLFPPLLSCKCHSLFWFDLGLAVVTVILENSPLYDQCLLIMRLLVRPSAQLKYLGIRLSFASLRVAYSFNALVIS